jgi:hypothetical protein
MSISPICQRLLNCGARPIGGAVGPLGARVCLKDIFILNEIWAKDKIFFLIGTLVEIIYLPLSTGTDSEL